MSSSQSANLAEKGARVLTFRGAESASEKYPVSTMHAWTTEYSVLESSITTLPRAATLAFCRPPTCPRARDFLHEERKMYPGSHDDAAILLGRHSSGIRRSNDANQLEFIDGSMPSVVVPGGFAATNRCRSFMSRRVQHLGRRFGYSNVASTFDQKKLLIPGGDPYGLLLDPCLYT